MARPPNPDRHQSARKAQETAVDQKILDAIVAQTNAANEAKRKHAQTVKDIATLTKKAERQRLESAEADRKLAETLKAASK